MNIGDPLKKDIMEAIQGIDNEADLKYVLHSIIEMKNRCKEREEEEREFEELKHRIGFERLNEVLEMARENTNEEEQKVVSKETSWGVTKLRRWLKKQFRSELMDKDTQIIARRVVYPDSYRESLERRTAAESEKRALHKEIMDALLEIGLLKSYDVASEFRQGNFQYDVIWKNRGYPNPFAIFEVQVSGNLIEALTKLKHAYYTWHSKIFLISDKKNLDKANSLLDGAFHEIKSYTKLLLMETVADILRFHKKLKEIDNLGSD